MVTQITNSILDPRGKQISQFAGLSTDAKPTDVCNGSSFIEINTGKIYFYNETGSTWVEFTK